MTISRRRTSRRVWGSRLRMASTSYISMVGIVCLDFITTHIHTRYRTHSGEVGLDSNVLRQYEISDAPRIMCKMFRKRRERNSQACASLHRKIMEK